MLHLKQIQVIQSGAFHKDWISHATRNSRVQESRVNKEGVSPWKCNNESWSGSVLVQAGADGKQGIYFAWP